MTMTFPATDLREQLREVEREIAQRHASWPSCIAAGRLKPTDAAYRIRVLEGVAVTLRQVLARVECTSHPTKEDLCPNDTATS